MKVAITSPFWGCAPLHKGVCCPRYVPRARRVRGRDRYCPPPRLGVAPRPATCHSRQERLAEEAARGRSTYDVVGEATPAHHVLRADLRTLVGGLPDVGVGPLPHSPGLQLRPFPR